MRSHRVVGVLVVAVTLLRIAAERADLQGASVYPLKLSPDGTYVTDRAGQPFFMNGDTAWSLIAQLSRVDADRYLSDRAATGFNTILVNLLEHRFANHAPSNRAGEPPFARPGDFTAPNPAYFANADWMIARAGERGILVLLDALYLGYDCGNEGWCAEVKASSPAALRMFGRYLGTRYRNVPNIVWVIGGDTDPVANGVGPHLRALVAGIRAADTTHLFTAHNGPEQSAMDVWAGESWLGLNNVYTYKNTWTKSLAERARQGAKPLFLMESAYENEHASTPLSLRRQAYGAVLSGATAGHLFGNCPMWHFNALTGAKFCTAGNWQDQLDSPGSATLALVGAILTSRRFHLLDPDHNHAVVTSGFESGADYASAARARDGSSILVYLPTPRTIRVDLSKLSGPLARGWWVNPGTASSTAAGEFPTSVARDFTPPDTNDWLLVLDDASLDLPAPGKRRP